MLLSPRVAQSDKARARPSRRINRNAWSRTEHDSQRIAQRAARRWRIGDPHLHRQPIARAEAQRREQRLVEHALRVTPAWWKSRTPARVLRQDAMERRREAERARAKGELSRVAADQEQRGLI